MKKLINFIKSLSKNKRRKQAEELPTSARVIARQDHPISRKFISKNALKVLYRLHNQGYSAYLVGGGVRDLLLGREPKDFDVATNALPQEIKKCFRNGRLIGKRFRLVHILFGREIIEVSTFRGEQPQQAIRDEHGMVMRDNVYGSLQDDAFRRDFTINAFYYNIANFTLLDFHNGLEDLKLGILRIIGDPNERFREDPVRMLRAIRFAAKLGFKIEAQSEKAMHQLKHLISVVASARLFTEILKLLLEGFCVASFSLLRHYDFLMYIFPLTEAYLKSDDYKACDNFLMHALSDTDKRIHSEKSVTPAFILSAFLWYPLQERTRQREKKGINHFLAFYLSLDEVFAEQMKTMALPKQFTTTMRIILELQEHFKQRKKKKILSLLEHPRFRAGYDFLLLRARVDEKSKILANWWTEIYEADSTKRHEMIKALCGKKRKKKKASRTS